MTSSAAALSVIVPAHDEAVTIEATLRTLLADASAGEFEVVVVCNGCQDDTADRARSVPGVTVLEIAAASKIAALREGDRRANTFPRIYLDGDTRLSTAGARALAAALEAPQARVAGLRADLDVHGASRGARRFHAFRQRLPVFAGGIIGAGVYALDETAWRRIAPWPAVVADDQFVLRSFAPSERATVTGHRSRVTVVGDLRDVVRRGIRVRRGNQELSLGAAGAPLAAPPTGVGAALRAALPRPSRWADAVVWLTVSSVIRVRSRSGRVRGDWVAGPVDDASLSP